MKPRLNKPTSDPAYFAYNHVQGGSFLTIENETGANLTVEVTNQDVQRIGVGSATWSTPANGAAVIADGDNFTIQGPYAFVRFSGTGTGSIYLAYAEKDGGADEFDANQFALFANFANEQFKINGSNVTFDDAFDFSRPSSKWVWGTGAQTGLLVEVPAGEEAIQHDPITGESLGVLLEGSATRLNTIAASPTVAENVTVSAVQHTISFFGTGTMTLSGAHSATVVGDGAFPTRTEYTFTPTAGALTLTPSGDVQHLQLEVGAVATSPIIGGEGTQQARASDFLNTDPTNFSGWFTDLNSGTFEIELSAIVSHLDVPTDGMIFGVGSSSSTITNNSLSLYASGSSAGALLFRFGAVARLDVFGVDLLNDTITIEYNTTTARIFVNGVDKGSIAKDASVNMATWDRVLIGRRFVDTMTKVPLIYKKLTYKEGSTL